MAIRVGIDLVSTDVVRESIEAHGERYLNRVFTRGELADCRASASLDPARLAARVAAKEAAFKAIGVGDRAVAWTDVEVGRGAAPGLSLSGRAATLALNRGVSDLSLSLRHEQRLAAAIVIAEIR